MINHIAKHKSILQVLRDSSPKLRKTILQNCDNKLICALVEIVHNLLTGNVPVGLNQLKRLRKYKTQFRQLSKHCINNKNKKINAKKSRRIILQTGGALPFLIAPILALIAKAALGGAAATTASYATKKIIDSATGDK